MDEKQMQTEIKALREKWIEALEAIKDIIPLARVGAAVMQDQSCNRRVGAAEALVPSEWWARDNASHA